MNKLFLQFEGLIVFIVSIIYYVMNDFPWITFATFLLAPDISMLGYLKNNRIGAVLYNIFHTYIMPLSLVFLSFIIHQDWLLCVAIIWTAHIGMDRAFGYGLKYPTAFKHTHLQKI